MKTFYAILANTLAASVTNTFVWFAVTFWIFLETRSVVATAVMAGIYTATVALSGLFLGSLVDRYRKKTVMLVSSAATLLLFALAAAVYAATPAAAFTDAGSPALWAFVVLVLFGAIAGNLRGIALSTLVTLLVPEDRRDKANGLVGTATGVAFMVASIFSGLAVGFIGLAWTLGLALVLTALTIAHLATVPIPAGPPAGPGAPAPATPPAAAPQPSATEGERGAVGFALAWPGAEAAPPPAPPGQPGLDLPGTIRAIRLVPGLFGLIFFHTFNNFLGGVFMSLMDAYGLLLVSVQAWGALWGVLSLGFIVGGLVVARRGLGPNPLRTLFQANVVMWSICVVFTLQRSIVLLAVGMFVWLCLIPAVEAAEQTILQAVVPYERQGRVFGFAQSVEQAASPITAFLIGPVAQFFFIPFMTTGAGVELIGGWFGAGTDRGLALLFIVSGLVGLLVTLLAMRSSAYRALSGNYRTAAPALSAAD
jgi:DHA3 family multidrug efflux protein-like MFS transporter